MSNKYEREIEEILRNLERTEPKAGFGRRTSGRVPRKPRPRRGMPTIRLTFSDWCLVLASIAALAAGGWAYAHNGVFPGANPVTGGIAIFGAACLLLVALSSFISGRRPRSSPSAARYTNVTRLPNNPFRRLAANWHLLMLKLRYRKRRDRER